MSVLTSVAQEKTFESTPLEVIEKGWGTKTIDNVINGSLGIMLERFDQTWPTWMGSTIRETMEKGLAKEVLDDETELTVTVDTKNGYAAIGDAGTDGAYMSLCYWNRSNGHKLFAVRLGKPTDPCLDFVCFYDYDAQKKTLKKATVGAIRKRLLRSSQHCRRQVKTCLLMNGVKTVLCSIHLLGMA